MANVNIELRFLCELNQTEFGVLTKALASKTLTLKETAIAKILNKRLLEARRDQIKDYTRQSLQSLKRANQEWQDIVKEHPELKDDEELEGMLPDAAINA
jgi:uncharacterized protein YqeY